MEHSVLGAGKEVSLEVNAERTKFICRHQMVGQNHNIKIANKSKWLSSELLRRVV
jgi:hypothetical protein